MNSINNQQFNYEDRYERMVNNIIYESIPQYKCPFCHSFICICDNKIDFDFKRSKIKYNSFNTEIGRQNYSTKNNKNVINLNKMRINPIQIPLYNENNNFGIISPASMRESQQKVLKNNFIFYNNNGNQTIYQNDDEKIYEQFSYNIQKNNYSNKRLLTNNYKRLNNSVSGRLVVPYFNNMKNINSTHDYYQMNKSPSNSKDNILTINQTKNSILDENFLSVKKGKNNKFRKIYLNKNKKEINKTLEKETYNSYLNIHKNPLINNNRLKNNKSSRECLSNSINNRYSNKINSFNHFKKNNSNFYNHSNLNLNNDYIYPINSDNIINFPQNSIEEMQKFYSSNFDDIPEEKNDLKNIIRLRRKNITSNSKDTIKSGEKLFENRRKQKRNTNYDNINPINKIYINNSKNMFNNNYISFNKTESSNENKENISNNIIENSFLKNKNINKKINIRLFEKLKKNFKFKTGKKEVFVENQKNKKIPNNNDDIKVSKNLFNKNNIKKEDMNNKNKNTNTNIDINKYKVKTNELISFLRRTNNEINKLKIQLTQLNDYNNLNGYIISKKNYNQFNNLNNNNSNENMKNYYPNKNYLKIKIREGNLNSNNNKNNFSNLNSEILNKRINTSNFQILNNNQNHTSINLPNFKNISNDSNINKVNDIHKNIFAIYNSKNKNFRNSILCFNAENKSFEIRNIDNSNNFNKNFGDSNSIYLIKNNNYYIISGLNCNKFYKYSYKGNKMSQLRDLKYNHLNGSMISYNDKIICLCGDFNKKVELYLENENKWLELPETQIERSYFSLCIIKNRYLFIFFGYNYPNRMYLNSIEFLDISNYHINNIMNFQRGNNIINWRYLDYNYYSNNESFQKINLIGSIAVNYNDEKIIFLGGKNYLINQDDDGYYQFIFDENDINDNEMIISYIEKIKTKGITNFKNIFFNNNYKYFEDLNQDNVLKEPIFVAFDNNYYVHMIKLSTMNHEVYNINF